MKKSQALEKIAKDSLNIDTLKTRMSDDLDFYNLSVWQIKKALEEAYEAGIKSVADHLAHKREKK